MKKRQLLLGVLSFFFSLVIFSACADYLGIEDSALSPEQILQIKQHNQVVYYVATPTAQLTVAARDLFPTGYHILLQNSYGSDLFTLNIFNGEEKICYWEEQITHPYRFKDKDVIYVLESNCPGMGEMTISWDLSEEKAFLDGEPVEIWTLVGSKYFLND